MGSYIRGLAVAILVSVIGIWLIYRSITNDTKFMGGLLELPKWLLILIGILMQCFLGFFVYLGIRAGFFR